MLIGVTCLTGLTFWCLWPRSGVSAANYGRIEQGMTRMQVEKLLGGGPKTHIVKNGELPMYLWMDGQVNIWVAFDQEGNVSKKSLGSNPPVSTGPRSSTAWDRIRWWFGL